jgi:PAS domain S-box-containing protein
MVGRESLYGGMNKKRKKRSHVRLKSTSRKRGDRSDSPKESNGEVKRSGPPLSSPPFRLRNPNKDQAIQRYVDLYDFAPMPYVSLDRTGKIEEVNLAGVELLGRPRKVLLGSSFGIYIAPEDQGLFSKHLAQCENSETRVETELRVRDSNRKIVPAYISSTPVASSIRDGALLLQTAIVDLRERRRVEEALLESQRHLDAALSTARMAAWEWDPETDRVRASRNISEIFGLRSDQELESSAFGFTLVHPDDVKRHRELVERAAKRGESWHDEFRIVRPRDNKIVWLEARATPMRDQQTGNVRTIAGLVWDITERKSAEETVHQSEIQLARELEDTKQLQKISSRLVEEDNAELLYKEILNAAIAIMRSDMGSLQMLGSSGNDLQLLTWSGFHPESAKYWKQITAGTTTSGGRALQEGERIIIPDVAKCDFVGKGRDDFDHFRRCGITAMQSTPLMSWDGRLVGVISTHWRKRHVPGERELRLLDVLARQAADVLERNRAGQKLKQTQERFDLLIEGAKEYAMFLLNPKNRIMFWSNGAERVFGWTAKEAVGKKGDLVFTPEDRRRRQVEKELDIAKREGRAMDRRWHLRKDGSRVWIDGVMQRLDDERTGEHRGFAKIARDATEQRRVEDELRHARDQLEQRVLERTADLMATNNELQRTMAQREQLERELLEISERERRRIGQDLHDVICQELTATALFLKSTGLRINNRQAAKILSEAAEIVNRNVSIARDLARGFQPVLAGSGGLTSALRELCKQANEEPQVHCTLILERAIRISDETVALNLFRVAQEAVRNAVSHSGASGITICIERERDLVRLVVEDNGKGFTPRKRSKGLGLHIMRYRTSALGGTFRIESRSKGGTRIVCEVPAKK